MELGASSGLLASLAADGQKLRSKSQEQKLMLDCHQKQRCLFDLICLMVVIDWLGLSHGKTAWTAWPMGAFQLPGARVPRLFVRLGISQGERLGGGKKDWGGKSQGKFEMESGGSFSNLAGNGLTYDVRFPNTRVLEFLRTSVRSRSALTYKFIRRITFARLPFQ